VTGNLYLLAGLSLLAGLTVLAFGGPRRDGSAIRRLP
jgi:hypothetical protein